MIRSYLKIVFRNLRRNRIHSFINIIGLSLGLACAMPIILYAKDEVSFDRFHHNVQNIYRIANTNHIMGKEQKDGDTGLLQGPRFKQNVPGIESFVRIQSETKDFKTACRINRSNMQEEGFDKRTLFMNGSGRSQIYYSVKLRVSQVFSLCNFSVTQRDTEKSQRYMFENYFKTAYRINRNNMQEEGFDKRTLFINGGGRPQIYYSVKLRVSPVFSLCNFSVTQSSTEKSQRYMFENYFKMACRTNRNNMQEESFGREVNKQLIGKELSG